MKKTRRCQALYASNYTAPRRRYSRLKGGTLLRKPASALSAAGVFILHILAFPFTSLSLLFQKKQNAKRAFPVELSADGVGMEAPEAPIRASRAPVAIPAASIRLHRIVSLCLVCATALSALFLGWAIAYSDPSIPVTVIAGGQTHSILTKAETVEELLANNGIVFHQDDLLNYDPASALLPGMEITVSSPFPVAIASGGVVSILSLHEGSVGTALELAGVTYDYDDELTALPYADVEPGMLIRHINVETEYKTVDEIIEYDEEIIKNNDAYIGIDKIATKGENGEKRTVRRIVYRDGVLSSREIMNQIILKAAVDEVKIVGTKIRYQTKLTGDTRVWKPKPTKDEIKKTLVAEEVTAYTHTGRRTSTGRRPRIGYVAVNPNVIPYGTKLYIPGYGYCTAQDTGAFRHENGGSKNQIDLFMETEAECKKWGRKRNLTIYLLK